MAYLDVWLWFWVWTLLPLLEGESLGSLNPKNPCPVPLSRKAPEENERHRLSAEFDSKHSLSDTGIWSLKFEPLKLCELYSAFLLAWLRRPHSPSSSLCTCLSVTGGGSGLFLLLLDAEDLKKNRFIVYMASTRMCNLEFLQRNMEKVNLFNTGNNLPTLLESLWWTWNVIQNQLTALEKK